MKNQPIITVLGKKYFSYSLTITFITWLEYLFNIPMPRWTNEVVTQVNHYTVTDLDYEAQETADNKDIRVTINNNGLLYRKKRL